MAAAEGLCASLAWAAAEGGGAGAVAVTIFGHEEVEWHSCCAFMLNEHHLSWQMDTITERALLLVWKVSLGKDQNMGAHR